MHNGKATNNSTIERLTCHPGTPKGMRNIMAMGEVNGMIESHVAKLPEGSLSIAGRNRKVSNNGMVSGRVNCCESVSLSVMAPTAAKRLA